MIKYVIKWWWRAKWASIDAKAFLKHWAVLFVIGVMLVSAYHRVFDKDHHTMDTFTLVDGSNLLFDDYDYSTSSIPLTDLTLIETGLEGVQFTSPSDIVFTNNQADEVLVIPSTGGVIIDGCLFKRVGDEIDISCEDQP